MRDPDFAKMSINAAIGDLLCRDQQFVYTVRPSSALDDIPSSNKTFMSTQIREGEDLFDYVTQKELLSLESYRAIWEQIMSIEYLRLAQARDLIRFPRGFRMKPLKQIRQCRMDCWLVSTERCRPTDSKKNK